MKRGRLVLGLSIGLNVILVGWLVLRVSEKHGASATPVIKSANERKEMADAEGSVAAREEVPLKSSDAWRSLHSDDLKTFAANLRAAGMSDAQVRAIVQAEIEERYRPREAALAPRRPKLAYWQFDGIKEPLETRLARLDLKREKARVLLETVGADPDASDASGLPPEKQELARMIAEDYDTLIGEFEQNYSTILLPSERTMLQQLQAEKHRELEELLSRKELTEFIVRSSPSGEYLRRQLRGFQPTEAEFRAIFEAQNEYSAVLKMAPFDDISRARVESFEAARTKMESELRAALGDDRYRSYVREKDPELQSLRSLADRVGASREAAERVYDLREMVTRESKRIGGDYSRSVDARKAEITALAQHVRAEIQRSFPSEAAEAYLQRARGWLTSLEQGQVVELREGSISSTGVQAAPAPRP